MTRCYEYYGMFIEKPEKCDLSVRGTKYVKKYIRFMQSRGVAFNGSEYDKTHFNELVEQYGTESVVTSPRTKVQKLAPVAKGKKAKITAVRLTKIELYEALEKIKKDVRDFEKAFPNELGFLKKTLKNLARQIHVVYVPKIPPLFE